MKRYIKRWISFILFMCVFVQYPSEGVVMAADSDQKNIQIVGTASMNTYDVALRVGKTKQLVCNGTTGKMVWKSSNPKVATVDKKGLKSNDFGFRWKSDRFYDLQGRRE